MTTEKKDTTAADAFTLEDVTDDAPLTLEDVTDDDDFCLDDEPTGPARLYNVTARRIYFPDYGFIVRARDEQEAIDAAVDADPSRTKVDAWTASAVPDGHYSYDQDIVPEIGDARPGRIPC